MTQKNPETRQQPPGTERWRDQMRYEDTPRYGGENWSVADERGDRRFGHARCDDAEPLERIKPGQGNNEDDESPAAADPVVAEAEARRVIWSSGQMAGIGRGEKPRKLKVRQR